MSAKAKPRSDEACASGGFRFVPAKLGGGAKTGAYGFEAKVGPARESRSMSRQKPLAVKDAAWRSGPVSKRPRPPASVVWTVGVRVNAGVLVTRRPRRGSVIVPKVLRSSSSWCAKP